MNRKERRQKEKSERRQPVKTQKAQSAFGRSLKAMQAKTRVFGGK